MWDSNKLGQKKGKFNSDNCEWIIVTMMIFGCLEIIKLLI